MQVTVCRTCDHYSPCPYESFGHAPSDDGACMYQHDALNPKYVNGCDTCSNWKEKKPIDYDFVKVDKSTVFELSGRHDASN